MTADGKNNASKGNVVGVKKFTIMGSPIPLARPRHGQRKVYDAQKHEKLVVGIALSHQMNGYEKLTGPLALDVMFFMALADSMSRKKRQERAGTFHYCRPDLSNLVKFVEDVAQGIIFDDDCAIVIINAKKVYDDQPRTEFYIREIGNGKKE